LIEALQPIHNVILTKERLEKIVPKIADERPRIDIKTTALTSDNIITSYYLNSDKIEQPAVKINPHVNIKILNKLRADLLDLEDCISVESIIIQVINYSALSTC